MGYDGQYTNGDTGLIYLRARYYDPGTGQFISNDPQVMETRAPYTYASDNPLSIGDPTGLTPWSPKVKQAVAQCRAWKNWYSQKSPYYHKQHGEPLIYNACNDLLSLPPEVYGTSSGSHNSVGKTIADLFAGAGTMAGGVVVLVGCGVGEGAAGLEGMMVEGHCAQVGIGLITVGGVVFGKGLDELHEQIP
jgi:RHS repeat-associated protein